MLYIFPKKEYDKTVKLLEFRAHVTSLVAHAVNQKIGVPDKQP